MESGFLEEALQALRDLGLTVLQAKVYLALTKFEFLTIAGISDFSRIQRPDLYRVIEELEGRGLVERIIAHPVQFKAIPLAECILLLLQRRNEETDQYRKKAIKLLQQSKNQTTPILQETHKPRFMLVPSSRVVERIGKAIDAARNSIDLILSWSRFSRGSFIYAENMEKALTRGVKCRMIIEKGEQENVSPEKLRFCQNPNCQTRLINRVPKTVLGVYDYQEVFIIESPSAELSASSALWSNNASLVALAQDFFDTLWQNSIVSSLK